MVIDYNDTPTNQNRTYCFFNTTPLSLGIEKNIYAVHYQVKTIPHEVQKSSMIISDHFLFFMFGPSYIFNFAFILHAYFF